LQVIYFIINIWFSCNDEFRRIRRRPRGVGGMRTQLFNPIINKSNINAQKLQAKYSNIWYSIVFTMINRNQRYSLAFGTQEGYFPSTIFISCIEALPIVLNAIYFHIASVRTTKRDSAGKTIIILSFIDKILLINTSWFKKPATHFKEISCIKSIKKW